MRHVPIYLLVASAMLACIHDPTSPNPPEPVAPEEQRSMTEIMDPEERPPATAPEPNEPVIGEPDPNEPEPGEPEPSEPEPSEPEPNEPEPSEPEPNEPEPNEPEPSEPEPNEPEPSEPEPSEPEPNEPGESITYAAHIQPVLEATCGECHRGQDEAPPFVIRFAATQQPSMYCEDATVGECVRQAADFQQAGDCHNRFLVYHRHWNCFTAEQAAIIGAWVDGGMIEQ